MNSEQKIIKLRRLVKVPSYSDANTPKSRKLNKDELIALAQKIAKDSENNDDNTSGTN